jgi:L-alanine-DL-glutamate epimerase-like enolase superfamily enzyme
VPGPSVLHIESLTAQPSSVPLLEPFVIASGRVDVTRAVEVEARVEVAGVRATGLGEGACLPPVTREDQPDVLAAVARAARELVGRTIAAEPAALAEAVEHALVASPVTRAGVESALLDALARAAGLPLRKLLAPASETRELETDVTIAIGEPARMAELARAWTARGFRALKVKVGKDVDSDVRALEAVGRAAPGAKLRVDANEGYAAAEALALAAECRRLGLAIECWEQPCRADDHDGMAEVSAALAEPVIADESVKTLADVSELARSRYADGVNLKLAKLGGVFVAVAAGRAARAAGLKLMIGGMVETRLGMTTAAHVACALGGVEYVDLDTAWLLATDPYDGGYVADGPRYTMPEAPGLAVTRPRRA